MLDTPNEWEIEWTPTPTVGVLPAPEPERKCDPAEESSGMFPSRYPSRFPKALATIFDGTDYSRLAAYLRIHKVSRSAVYHGICRGFAEELFVKDLCEHGYYSTDNEAVHLQGVFGSSEPDDDGRFHVTSTEMVFNTISKKGQRGVRVVLEMPLVNLGNCDADTMIDNLLVASGAYP